MQFYRTQPSFAPLRFRLWLRDAKRDEEATASFTTGSHLPLLDIYRSDFLDASSSKTLFILGSGWSVNELSKNMLVHMHKHQSVGINFWFFHDFVPSAFSFDAGVVPDSEKNKVRETLVSLGKLFDREPVVKSRPKVLYLRPFELDRTFMVPLPAKLEGLAWVSGRANLLALTRKALEADLKVLLPKLVRKKLPSHILPDNGSSVVRLIFLALAQGFREIVLVGVDLDDRPHFWFSSEYAMRFGRFVELFPPPDKELHGTAGTSNRPIGGKDFLETFDKVIRELNIGSLKVASPTSQLAQTLEQYQWPQPKNA